jgi:hypothetical protein
LYLLHGDLSANIQGKQGFSVTLRGLVFENGMTYLPRPCKSLLMLGQQLNWRHNLKNGILFCENRALTSVMHRASMEKRKHKQ